MIRKVQYMLLQVSSFKLKDTIHSALWEQWKQNGRVMQKMPTTYNQVFTETQSQTPNRSQTLLFQIFFPTDRNCRWINICHQPSNSAALEAAKDLWNSRNCTGRAGAMGARVGFDSSSFFSKLWLDIKTRLTAWCCCVETLSYEHRVSVERCSVVFWIILSGTFAWNIAVTPVARLVFCSIPTSRHISLTMFPKAFLPNRRILIPWLLRIFRRRALWSKIGDVISLDK